MAEMLKAVFLTDFERGAAFVFESCFRGLQNLKGEF